MTLHQQILTSAPTSDRSDVFRLRALFCERQVRESTGWTSKQDWEVLAIECHTVAYLAARMNGEISQIDVARRVDSLWRNRLPAHHEGPLPHPAQDQAQWAQVAMSNFRSNHGGRQSIRHAFSLNPQ